MSNFCFVVFLHKKKTKLMYILDIIENGQGMYTQKKEGKKKPLHLPEKMVGNMHSNIFFKAKHFTYNVVNYPD